MQKHARAADSVFVPPVDIAVPVLMLTSTVVSHTGCCLCERDVLVLLADALHSMLAHTVVADIPAPLKLLEEVLGPTELMCSLANPSPYRAIVGLRRAPVVIAHSR